MVDRAREVFASLGKDVRRVGKNDIVVFDCWMCGREVSSCRV